MAIISKAPLRISFAGGGTDLEPFCSTHGGCVLSATINQYAYVKIEPNPSLTDDTWMFCSPDFSEENKLTGDIDDWDTNKSTLLVKTYKHMYKKYQFELSPVKITGYCETPPGSGLGSSSAYTVATVSAINRYYALGLSKYDIADVSHYIERDVCSLPGGKQDQYASTFGGINFIEFKNQVLVNPIELPESFQEKLQMSTVLYYIGGQRNHSVIEDNIKNLQENKDTITKTFQLKENCNSFFTAITTGDQQRIVELMNENHLLKKQLSSKIIDPYIEEIYQTAITHGAMSGKICGAGGGGHMIFFTDFTKRHNLIKTLNSLDGHVVPFSFTHKGTITWSQ